MVALAGVGASCSAASTLFTNASKWTMSLKGVTKDVTPFSASGNWTVNLGTLKSWTAKITCFADTSDTAQTGLLAILNTPVALAFNVDSTPDGFTGSAILTSVDPSVDAQNVETVDYSFTGTGPVTGVGAYA